MSFKFKQFDISHDRSAMKVGTDGVLLGAWTLLHGAKSILDIGTGCGLIALMLAQRSEAHTIIDAVEIEKDSADEAKENFTQSPWPNKVNLHHCSIQNYQSEKKYDLIVSNPPYFRDSYKSPDEKRTQTRHTFTLSFVDLLHSVKRLLNVNGRFNVILPYKEGFELIDLAKNNNIYCTRQWSLKTRKEKPIERWLLEFGYQAQITEQGEVIMYDQGEEWSKEYMSLTTDFYLKF